MSTDFLLAEGIPGKGFVNEPEWQILSTKYSIDKSPVMLLFKNLYLLSLLANDVHQT